MQVVFSDQQVPSPFPHPSLFLAGPTPRLSKPVASWRPDALALLEGFDGTAFVPEYSSFRPMRSYEEQVEWEWAALHGSTVVVFWVPRCLETLPAFTTNVEFGFYLGKKPVVYGRPDDAPKNTYLDWLYGKAVGKKPENTLASTLAAAIKLCRSGEPPCGNG